MLRRNSWLVGVGLCVSVAVGSACSTTIRDGYSNDADGGGNSSGGNSSNGGGDFNSSGGLPVSGAVKIRGTTYAPNGTLPLAGVLVYTLEQKPDPIPDGVYCDKCRELPENRFALSAANGSFEFTADPGTRYLVVEKGQFRRVRQIEIDGEIEEIDLEKELSTLPSTTTSNGEDTIPKIALLAEPTSSARDRIQIALRGLGIEDWDNLGSDASKLADLGTLSKYHIVMIPCIGGAFDEVASNAQNEAIQAYTAAGGKVYVSDYSMGFADGPYKDFFAGKIAHGSKSSSSISGRYEDEGLRAWLQEVDTENPDNARFEGVYTHINGLRESAEVPDETGNFALVQPKIWATTTEPYTSGASTEAAVSFQYGCGRGMFSVFHVHGGNSANLSPQEKALIYMLLDVSACAGPPVPVN